jgi:uncharacterized cupredoxin-like copper-binding protein
VALCCSLLLAGCGGDDDGGGSGPTSSPAQATEGAAATEFNVTLQEYIILPEADSIAAGEVTFNAENIGPDDVHEFAIVRTDLAPDALPRLPDNTVDESAEGLEVLGRVEELAVGESGSVTVDMQPGAYVLVCNLFEAAENEAHYDVGMYTGFTVE